MVIVKTRQLKTAYGADADFVFLRVALEESGMSMRALERWQGRARSFFWGRASIGGPISLGDCVYVIDLEGVDTFPTLEEIAADLAETLEREGFVGEISGQHLEYSPLDDPLAKFSLTAVAASVNLGRGVEDQARERGYFSRDDLDSDSLAAIVSHALEWCLVAGGEVHVAVDVLSIRTPGSSANRLILAAMRNPRRVVSLTSSRWPEVGRRVTFTPDGHVLYHFGSAETYESPGRIARHVQRLLTEIAPSIEYACALQTSEAALSFTQLLRTSWFEPPGFPAHLLATLRELEASRVPDAFACQLLGPKHAVENLILKSYEKVDVIKGRSVLTRKDVAAWLSGCLPARGIVARARDELSPVILSPADLEGYKTG